MCAVRSSAITRRIIISRGESVTIAICRVNAGIKVCQSLHCTNLEYRLVGPAEPRSYGDVRLCPARPCTARLFALAISSSSMAISAPAAMEAAIFFFRFYPSSLPLFTCVYASTLPVAGVAAECSHQVKQSVRGERISKIFSNYSFNLKDGDQIRMSVPERRGCGGGVSGLRCCVCC